MALVSAKWSGVAVVLALAVTVGGFAAAAAAEGRDRRDGRKASPTTLPAAVDRKVSYVDDVKPILEDRCYHCHAEGEHKGGFRMDTRQQFLKEDVVVVGDSAKSKLVRMIAAAGVEKDEIMPPKGKRLTDEQIGILRAWIDQGLEWGDSKDKTDRKTDPADRDNKRDKAGRNRDRDDD